VGDFTGRADAGVQGSSDVKSSNITAVDVTTVAGDLTVSTRARQVTWGDEPKNVQTSSPTLPRLKGDLAAELIQGGVSTEHVSTLESRRSIVFGERPGEQRPEVGQLVTDMARSVNRLQATMSVPPQFLQADYIANIIPQRSQVCV
jgi:hypothetical protein